MESSTKNYLSVQRFRSPNTGVWQGCTSRSRRSSFGSSNSLGVEHFAPLVQNAFIGEVFGPEIDPFIRRSALSWLPPMNTRGLADDICTFTRTGSEPLGSQRKTSGMEGTQKRDILRKDRNMIISPRKTANVTEKKINFRWSIQGLKTMDIAANKQKNMSMHTKKMYVMDVKKRKPQK